MKQITKKKGVMNEVVSVAVLVLVVSVLFGLTFLFTSELKEQVEATAGTTSVAYQAVNDTETAGATIVDYLPLVFLSLIFGAILVLVLRIIVPYLNLGRNMGSSF